MLVRLKQSTDTYSYDNNNSSLKTSNQLQLYGYKTLSRFQALLSIKITLIKT